MWEMVVGDDHVRRRFEAGEEGALVFNPSVLEGQTGSPELAHDELGVLGRILDENYQKGTLVRVR
jgi:hypothetical protein